MKTFDEVIKALSICGRHPDCEGCPYKNISYPTEIGNTCKDIMHYDVLYYMQDQCKIFDTFENLPLTWDELRLMEGKPVWIEKCQDDEIKGWLLILRTNADVITCTTKYGNNFHLYKSLYELTNFSSINFHLVILFLCLYLLIQTPSPLHLKQIPFK